MASAPDASAAQPAAPRTPEPQARSSSAAGGVSPSPRLSPRIAKLQLGDRPTMGLDEAGDNTSRTGLVYDEYCLQHRANYKHVEGPQRTQAIFERFFEAGLVARCRRVDAVEAPVADLQRAHDAEYVQMINDTQKEAFPAPEPDSEDENDDTVYPGCRFLDGDTYVNEHSAKAARLSCGGLTELAAAVVQGELANGFAVIRPPGHHANGECASGFCLFNNVGVASRAIQARFPEIERVAIVDWDVHHGDGTQAIFDSDASVLYTSIHRYENGTFFPYTGGIDEVGSGAARGKCVNIPLPCADLGDVEYLECVEDVLVPILREFRPQLLFVSAGFDCADGDPLGGMHVTPDGFAHMTHLLMQEGVVENDRIVVALEGGYNPDAISAAAEACMHTLLGDPLPARPTKPKVGRNSRLKKKLANRARVFHTALNRVIRAQAEFWTCMQEAVDSKGLKKSPAKSEPEPQPEPQPEPEPVDNEEAELRKAMEGLTLDG